MAVSRAELALAHARTGAGGTRLGQEGRELGGQRPGAVHGQRGVERAVPKVHQRPVEKQAEAAQARRARRVPAVGRRSRARAQLEPLQGKSTLA